MFEISLMESSGRLRSKSGRYLWLTGSLNVAVVAAMMVVPLLYPEALPRTAMIATTSAPLPPPAAPSRAPVTHATAVKATAALTPFVVPTKVPARSDLSRDDPPPSIVGVDPRGDRMAESIDLGPVGSIGLGPAPPIVTVAVPKPPARVAISSGVIAGNKLSGASPVYPAIAKAAHVSGAVILHAVIAKNGDMQSLDVVSGPEMLRSSAVAAVQGWKYCPYLLNGVPTKVDTTITVNFTFGG